MMRRHLPITCFLLLASGCAIQKARLPYPSAWIPLFHEERAIDWAKYEFMEGLKLALPEAQPELQPLEVPFQPVLPMAVALASGPEHGMCSPVVIDPSYFGRLERSLPEDWKWTRYVFTWLYSECRPPQNPEEVGPWVSDMESILASAPNPALRQWSRERWIRVILNHDVFWQDDISLNDLTLDQLGENYDAEAKSNTEEIRAAWFLWWSQLVQSRGEIQKARFMREYLLLNHPSDAVISFIQKRYPQEYPFATSLLPVATRLEFVRALLKHGDVDQSLQIATSIYRTEKGDPKIDAASLIEEIYRARGEPEKYYQWKLKNQQSKAISENQTKTKNGTKSSAASSTPDPVASPDLFYTYVRTLWNANDPDKALNLIQSTSSQEISKSMAQRLQLLKAQIMMEKGQWSQVVELLEGLSSPLKDEKDTQWLLCMATIFSEDDAKAIATLDNYLAHETDPLSRSKALFWKAFVEDKLHQDENKASTLFTLFNEDPISFYSEMGLQQIQGKHSSTQSSLPPLFLTSPYRNWEVSTMGAPTSPPLTQEFHFLLYFPDRQISQLWLKQFPNTKIPPEWQSAAGQHVLSIPKLVEWRRSQKKLPEYFHRLYFPREYWTIIRDVSSRYSVDPFLILALIRQESIFQEKAISAARAMGTMQLLPGTAQEVHRNLPRTSPLRSQKFYPERLFDPRWSIELGTAYISRLLRSYKGNWIATIGAYNAGPGAMRNWMKKRYHANPLLFIERIPYTETRFYIQLVLRNYSFYRRIFTGEAAQISLVSPTP